MYKKIIVIGIIILFIASIIIPMSFGYNLIKYPSTLSENYNMFVRVSGIPPVANFTIYYNYSNSLRGVVRFDGSMSYDPDGIIVSYEWDYGDGTSDNSSYWYEYHQYCDCKITYNVTLTVTDNEGLKGNLTKSVFVVWANYPPPYMEIQGPSSGQAGTEYNYGFRELYPEDFRVFLLVDWGDGNSTGWFEPSPWITYEFVFITHTWSKKGTYIIESRGKDYCSEFPPAYFEVTITKNKAINFNSLFYKMLKQFPFLQKLLYRIK
jgi:hypothetical protein